MTGRFRTIARDLGQLLQALAVLMATSIVVPLLWREFYAVGPLVGSALLTGANGTGFERRYVEIKSTGHGTQPSRYHPTSATS